MQDGDYVVTTRHGELRVIPGRAHDRNGIRYMNATDSMIGVIRVDDGMPHVVLQSSQEAIPYSVVLEVQRQKEGMYRSVAGMKIALARELLEKYERSETSLIWNYSGTPQKDIDTLKTDILPAYEKRIKEIEQGLLDNAPAYK